MAYSKNTKPIKIAVGKTTALNYIKSFSANAKTPEEKKEIENLVRLVDAFEKDIARLLQDSNFEYKKILLDDLYTLLKNLKVLTENNINAISDLAKSNIKGVLGKISGNSEAARDLGDILDYANKNLPVLLKHLYKHLDKHFTEVDKVISGLTDPSIFEKSNNIKSDINNLFGGFFSTVKTNITVSIEAFGKNILNSINSIDLSSPTSYKSVFKDAKKTSNKLIKVLDKLEELSKGVLQNQEGAKTNISSDTSIGISGALTSSIELKRVDKELDKLNSEHKKTKSYIDQSKKSGGIFTFLASTLFTPPGMFFAGFLYGYFEKNILYLFNEYLNPLLQDIVSGKASDKLVKHYHRVGEYWISSLNNIDYALYTISNMFEVVLKSFDWLGDAATRLFPYLQSILSIFLDPESLRRLWNTVEGHVLAQQYINMTTRAFNVAAKRIASLAIVGGGGSNFGFFGISGFSEILRSIPGLALSGVNWWLAYRSVKTMFDEAIPESLDDFEEIFKLDQEKYKNEVNALLDKYSPYKAYSSEQEYKPANQAGVSQVGRLGTIQIHQESTSAGTLPVISDLRVGSDLSKTFVQSSVYDTDALKLARANGLRENEAKSIARLDFNPIISGANGNPLVDFDKMFGTATLQASKDLSIDGQTNQLMSIGSWVNLDDGLSHKELIDSISAKGLTDMNSILNRLIRSYGSLIEFGNDDNHLKNLSHAELITKIYNKSLINGKLDKTELDKNISKFIIDKTNISDTQTMRDMFRAYFAAVDRTHINYAEMLNPKNNVIDASGNINVESALKYGSASLATTRTGIGQSVDVFNIQALAKAAERYGAVYDDLMKSGNVTGAQQARENMMFLRTVIKDLSNGVLASNSVISEGLKNYLPEVSKQLNDILAKRVIEHRNLIKESIDSYLKDREERTSQNYLAPVAEQDIVLIHRQFNEPEESLSY